MAKKESNPKEQIFRLHYTGHLPNRIKPNEEQVRSTTEDVKEFCTVFYSKCNLTGTDFVTSRHFYSKVGFILSDKSPHGYDILIDLICDTGLLFAQDFGMDVDTDNGSQGINFDAFSLNRKYFKSRPDKMSFALRIVQNEIEKEYFGDSEKEFLGRRFNDFINGSFEGMTPEKMKSMQIPASYLDGLDNKDIEWLQNVVLPKFIQNWGWYLWMKYSNKHYKRVISIWHRAKLDCIKLRKELMQQAYDKAVEWLSLEPQNIIYIKSPSYQTLEKVIYNVGLQRLQIEDSKIERFINKIIRAYLKIRKCDIMYQR